MRRTIIEKTLSLSLVVAMLISIPACGKKTNGRSGKSGRTILAEDPWFECKNYHIEPDLDVNGKTISIRQHELVGADDKYIVVLTRGYFSQNGSDEEYHTNDHGYTLATIVDRNTGDKVRTVNLQEYIPDEGSVTNVTYADGKITSEINRWNDAGSSLAEVDIDVKSGEMLCERPKDMDDVFSAFNYVFHIGKNKIVAAYDFGKKSSCGYYKIEITSADGKESHVDLKKNGTDLGGEIIVLPLEDEKILATIKQTSANVPVSFEVDMKNAKAVEADAKAYDWLDFDMIKNVHIGMDGQAYFSTSDGISKIDMKNKKIVEFFDFDACSINHALLCDTEMVDCFDDKVILLGGCLGMYSFSGDIDTGFEIYVLSKAKVNPHAGKTLLELYATNGYVEYPVAQAMCEFNDKNEKYFIEVTGRYKLDMVRTFLPTESEDDIQNDMLRDNLVLSDSLAMDILNGDGPDILILSGDMGRLNYSDYLVDLSMYFGDLDPEKYFRNIIDAAKTDGKLYQVPITFGIKGIHTDAKYSGASGHGFTTKEYEEFLYGPLNGVDLNSSGQAMYFTTLFNAMRETFIQNGKVNFSGPEFAELADFVKKNVRQKAPTFDSEEDTDESEQNDRIALLSTYSQPMDYLVGMNSLLGAKAFLGIPSADGRGPQITSYCSIAVSSHAPDVDACAEFAKILLSDEKQYELSKTNGIPISRAALSKLEDEVLEYANSPKADSEFFLIIGNMIVTSERRLKFTKDDMKDFEKIIESCSHFDTADASIDLILIEEMPPYFLGQKDLPAVIKIISDRVQKVLDERGT